MVKMRVPQHSTPVYKGLNFILSLFLSVLVFSVWFNQTLLLFCANCIVSETVVCSTTGLTGE